MSVAKDCHRYAVQCLQHARTTVDARQKTFLVEMAQAWQRLAERENMPETVTFVPSTSWIAATDCLLVLAPMLDGSSSPGSYRNHLPPPVLP